MNRLFVVNKPIFISSNHYLNRIKRKYKNKKAGFSGTLDPFAKGCLIVAFGKYSKLFQYLKKSPKSYKATLYLGAYSPTLDLEKIEKITSVEKIEIEKINSVLKSFLGKQKQLPPKYSAKKINGIRAYKIADQDIKLKECDIEIFDIKLINYCHPFLTFEATVSEGSYIRSLGFDIAKKLGVDGALTALERLNEGEFIFENEKALDPIKFLKTPKNEYLGDVNNLLLGKKLNIEDFSIKEENIYYIEFENYFSIIEITKNQVIYKLNLIKKFKEEEC